MDKIANFIGWLYLTCILVNLLLRIWQPLYLNWTFDYFIKIEKLQKSHAFEKYLLKCLELCNNLFKILLRPVLGSLNLFLLCLALNLK